MRIAHLGPAGTFTEEAARPAAKAVGAQLAGFATVAATLDAVRDGAADVGLVPIENSLEGTVTATVDRLSAHAELAIVGEAVLPITQCLIARASTGIDRVDAVLSHPQGLAQCTRFLRERLPAARLVPAASTADAVRALAAEPAGSAAIASRGAAALYGGVVLAEGIEDEPGNATRFAWVARAGGAAFPPAADGARWKTSVLFGGSGDDSPGWLVRCLSEFAFRGVNLVKIESRPARRRLGHYRFLADCEGRREDDPVTGAIAALSAHCEEVRVLGSYPAAPSTRVS